MYTSRTKSDSENDNPIAIKLKGTPKTDLLEISEAEKRSPTGEVEHLISEQKLRLKHKGDNLD